MTVLCVLPARIGSRRLPRKPLQPLAGRPLIEWTWRAARRASGIDEIWVATDDPEIAMRVRDLGGTVVMTSPEHPSGTDRVAEAARRPEAAGFDVILNLQADEPFLSPAHLEAVLAPVRAGRTGVATLATPFAAEREWRSPSHVKVVRAADGRALYFSRAPVPWSEDGLDAASAGAGPGAWLRHVGVYAFTRPALERFVSLPPSRLERLERLEQLRALEAGIGVFVAVAGPCEAAVDVPEDLERAERLLAARDPN
ncbi:MAG: 3-deoxy-manno-octulosonate cytidylyltransferase [Gemmatimonadota bacterium]|nr:3-deoxy-manno-octulosonate cytidylyltransferase [Gemmatimonadota bacterium]